MDEPQKLEYVSAKFLTSPGLHIKRVSIYLGDNSVELGIGRKFTLNSFVSDLLVSKHSENIEELKITVQLSLPFPSKEVAQGTGFMRNQLLNRRHY